MGRLTLSVFFVNGTYAQRGRLVPSAEAKIEEIPSKYGNGLVLVIENGFALGADKVFSIDDDAFPFITGVWDLPMIGGEKDDVEHKYQVLIGGPTVN